MEVEIAMLCKISQAQKNKYCMFLSHIRNLEFQKKYMKVEGELFGKRKGASGKGEGTNEGNGEGMNIIKAYYVHV
jgi:hypothetical protein